VVQVPLCMGWQVRPLHAVAAGQEDVKVVCAIHSTCAAAARENA